MGRPEHYADQDTVEATLPRQQITSSSGPSASYSALHLPGPYISCISQGETGERTLATLLVAANASVNHVTAEASSLLEGGQSRCSNLVTALPTSYTGKAIALEYTKILVVTFLATLRSLQCKGVIRGGQSIALKYIACLSGILTVG